MNSLLMVQDSRERAYSMSVLDKILLGCAMYSPFSTIKKCLYRISGATVGKKVYMAPGVAINCSDMRRVNIGDNCSLGLNVWIRCESIGMSDNTKIAGGACINGKNTVSLGRSVYIGQNAFLDCWETIIMEDRVQVSPGAMILTHDSSEHYISGESIFAKPIVIRKKAYIGAGAIVLPGVDIGQCAIIGAGAVVTKSVPAHTTVVGNPANVLNRELY